MSYGIEITNNNNRILVDENYPNMGYQSTTASSYTVSSSNNTFTGNANELAGDLVIGRAGTSSDGWVGRGLLGNWPKFTTVYHPNPAATIEYYLTRNLSGLLTAATSGYGMEVYGSNGTDVYFSSNISKGLDIVEIGTFNSSSAGVEYFRYPASGNLSDFHKHYCVLNNTIFGDLLTSGFPNIAYTAYIRAYQYNWATSTTGYFNIGSWYQTYYTQTFQMVITRPNIDFQYMILKELS
jgi:hypothetical protein